MRNLSRRYAGFGIKARGSGSFPSIQNTVPETATHSHGKKNATTVIDSLLDVRDATPDFWILAGSCQPAKHSASRLEEECAKLLFRIIEWYGVHPNQAILISNASSTACPDHGAIAIRTIQAGDEPDKNGRQTIELAAPEPMTFAALRTKISRLSYFS